MQTVIDRLEEMRKSLRPLTDAVQRGNTDEAGHLLLIVGSLLEEALREATQPPSLA
jgi:hypothetical protein